MGELVDELKLVARYRELARVDSVNDLKANSLIAESERTDQSNSYAPGFGYRRFCESGVATNNGDIYLEILSLGIERIDYGYSNRTGRSRVVVLAFNQDLD